MTSVLLSAYEIHRLRRNIRGVLEGKRERSCMVRIWIMVNTLRQQRGGEGQLPLSTDLECMKIKTKNADRLCKRMRKLAYRRVLNHTNKTNLMHVGKKIYLAYD